VKRVQHTQFSGDGHKFEKIKRSIPNNGAIKGEAAEQEL